MKLVDKNLPGQVELSAFVPDAEARPGTKPFLQVHCYCDRCGQMTEWSYLSADEARLVASALLKMAEKIDATGAERLSELTMRPRVSLADVARLCGVSPQAVTQWANGSVTPRPEHRDRLQDEYGIPHWSWDRKREET